MYKCNSDGAARGNPGPCSEAFCVRNKCGDLIDAEGTKLSENSNLIAEVIAFRMGLEYCIQHQLISLVVEKDSLTIKNILDGVWKVPWCITVEIGKIKFNLQNATVEVVHTYR